MWCALRTSVFAVVAEDDVEEGCLVPPSRRVLVQCPADECRVENHQVTGVVWGA